jgi:uncharacterized protein
MDRTREADERHAPRVRVVVPYTDLSADALRGVIEAFVLREGTEYGALDVTLAVKVEQVLRQLVRGEAQILFEPVNETIDIVVARTTDRRG